jgi:RNA polymerase sigma factor (sigma-70 family)
MLRVAYSITGNRATAEDAVHDAFCTVGPRIGTLDDPVPYLRVAVVNRCRTMHRSAQRASKHVAQQLTDDVIDVGLTDFGDALEHLSFPQRAAIVLRYLCDLSDDEIAHVLNCRRSTVRSHVRRGLDHLRQELS